ncbi:MAG: T9SS type A sorting domain-containing protein [Flavobacteriales bacterium]|nr:T9SS type A sorting domain-containing protein [Flavobacteriales bacterium]
MGKFSGSYTKTIDLGHVGSGTYLLNIIQGNQKLAEKIIVQ